MSRALKPVEEFLREAGVPYHIDTGKKHHRVFVAGKLATVVSLGSRPYGGPSYKHQTMAALRRAVRAFNSEGNR